MNAIAATDGEIAALNLESACRRAWSRFTHDPRAPGLAEMLADMERLRLQFFGDIDALDRLDALTLEFARADNTFRAALVHAGAASTAHRFAEARDHLSRAASMGAREEDVQRQSLTIDQACGTALEDVLTARRQIAGASGRLEDLMPLGALLAELGRFAEAHTVYSQALDAFDGTSPFPPAWASFQLGMLWGELVPEPDADLAAAWYRRAVALLPGYVKARVHLAELCRVDAESLLKPVLGSGDPEVSWRLADALDTQGRSDEAQTLLGDAQRGFEGALEKHPLAFADHAAEFYAGSGNNLPRALELARMNAGNRPTRRAIAQMRSIAAAMQPRNEPHA